MLYQSDISMWNSIRLYGHNISCFPHTCCAKTSQRQALRYVCYMPCYEVVRTDTFAGSFQYSLVQSVRVERREYFPIRV